MSFTIELFTWGSNKGLTLQLKDKSLKPSLLFYKVSPFHVIYLMKEPCHLTCRISHILWPIASLWFCLTPYISCKLIISSRGFLVSMLHRKCCILSTTYHQEAHDFSLIHLVLLLSLVSGFRCRQPYLATSDWLTYYMKIADWFSNYITLTTFISSNFIYLVTLQYRNAR